MPFNIELLKTKPVVVKLQVVKNQLNMYFKGPIHIAADVREDWEVLIKSFIKNFMQYLDINAVESPDHIHLKREHTSIYELTELHEHTEFYKEINPELLALFLNFIYSQQAQHADPRYHFFTDRAEVNDIVAKFKEYYGEYKQSRLELHYEQETKLTPEEQAEYDDLVQENSKKNRQRMSRLLFLSQQSNSNHIFQNSYLRQQSSDDYTFKP